MQNHKIIELRKYEEKMTSETTNLKSSAAKRHVNTTTFATRKCAIQKHLET